MENLDNRSSPETSHTDPTSPPRRTALYAGVAALAGAAGSGGAWWKFQPHAVAEMPHGESVSSAFFKQSFESPDGVRLQVSNFAGKPLLLNFWATWCPPCVAELPMLNTFLTEQQGRGWQILGLAVDQPSAVRKFLERSPVAFPVGMAGLEGTELSRSLGNLTGGLPFTVVFGADGTVRHRKMGQLDHQDLATWAKTIS